MEAWKDELYHWGIKGMKWKKRKKTSDLGREFEQNERRRMAMEQYTWDNVHTKDDNKFNRMKRETLMAEDRAYNSAKKLGDRSAKILKRIQRDDPKKRLKNEGRRYGSINSQVASGSDHNLTGTDEAKAKANKRVRRRVAAVDAKNKAKSYLKNLFGRKKK